MTVTDLDHLTQDQSLGAEAVVRINQVIRDKIEIKPEDIQETSFELKQLYKMKDAMRIDEDGTLEVWLIKNGRKVAHNLPRSQYKNSNLADTPNGPVWN